MSEELAKPDELTEPSWAPERIGPQVEIVRYPEATAILNNDAKLSIWSLKLADNFQHGMPEDWQQLSAYNQHVFVGDVDGQRFLAKYKRNRPDEHRLSRIRSLPPHSSTRATYGSESLVNEIHMSPTVQAAVDDPATQEAIRSLGFSGLRFVEPVMGVIAQHSAATLTAFDEAYDPSRSGVSKMMVYEYIPNLHPLSGPNGVLMEDGVAEAEQRQALESAVRKRLRAGKIEPNDFGLKQMGVDDSQMLYLFDIEQYAGLHKR